MVYFVIVQDAVSYHLAIFDKEFGIPLKVVALDECHGRPYAGDDEENDKDGAYAACLLLHCLVDEIDLAELQVFHANIGGQHDEYAVDEKQVGRTDEVAELSVCQSVARSAERGHKGCGYGYTGKYGSLILAALLQYAGKAAEQRYQDIINRWIGAGKQFAGVVQAEWSQQEVEERCHEAYRNHDKQVLHRRLDEFGVIDSQAEADTEDGPHQGRDEHGTNDYRYGVDVEAY